MFTDRKDITTLYNPKELLQEKWSDFDIMRSKPLVFNVKGLSLAVMPLTIKDHPRFLKSLSMLLVRYYEIFSNIQFLSAAIFEKKHELDRIISQVMFFNSSKKYERFITRDCVSFVREFAVESKDGTFRSLGRWKARRFLSSLTPEELLQIFFTIIVFNHDIVKKKTLAMLSRLGISSVLGVQTGSPSSNSIGITTPISPLPKYSDEPFSRESLNQLEELSRLN